MPSSAYKYSRWDGTQNIFDVDASELMDRLSDDLLSHGDVWKALRELMRQGMGQQTPGLKALMERLKERREHQLQQYNLDSVMEDLKERLDNILEAEQQGIKTRLDEARREIDKAEGPERAQMEELNKLLEQRAQRNLEKLDNLPQSPGGIIRELMEYDFMDPDAQQMFQELLDTLRGQMAGSISQDMIEQLRNMTPEQMSAMREMLHQLNQMLRDRLTGQTPDFERFMQQFGPMFGQDPPNSLDELLEQMMGQAAQMQSLMDSMSPEARQELEDVLASALDPETRLEMVRLASFLEQLLPMDEMRRQYPFLGDDSLTLERAMELMGQLQDMDELERSIREAMRTGSLDEIDPDKLAEQLGEEGRRTWEQLQRLMEMLKEEGYITDDNQPELTPKAIRRIGQRALKEVFINLRKDRVGDHQMEDRGSGGDALTQTKPYEFGDPFQLDLHASIKNALARAGPHVPVHLDPSDFEIYLNWEEGTQASALAEKFGFLQEVLRLHEDGEDDYIFPELDGKFSHVVAAYSFDHKHHTKMYDGIQETLSTLKQGVGKGEGPNLVRELGRRALAYDALMSTHVGKENELLVPLFDEYFSVDEQNAMLGKMMSHFTPELIQKMIPWMFMAQSADDKVAMMQEFKQMFPPEMFKGMTMMLSQAVPAQDWQETVRRMPELGA